MKLLLLVMAMLILASGAGAVRTTWQGQDAEPLLRAMLEDGGLRASLDARVASRGPVGLRLDVTDGVGASFVYDGDLRVAQMRDAYVAQMSTDAALAVQNAELPARALRCMVAEGAITLRSPSVAERVALHALADRAADGLSCGPPVDAREVGPGLWVAPPGDAYDRFGSRIGWQDADAPRWLGRADAGISRLAPEGLPRGALPDLRDPWRAAAAPEMRALLAAAADCPCAPQQTLIPAGDWRAALAADPRTQEAAS